MAKKKYSKRSKKFTVPVALAAPMVGLGIAIAKDPVAQANLGYIMTGYQNGHFDTSRFVMTYGPIVAGALVHKGANMLGINRMIASAKIPIIRL